MKKIKEKELVYLAYVQRERSFVHHTYDEETHLAELISRGDEAVVELYSQKFCSEHNGHLSSDPLRDKKYLFVVEATLITRAAIKGGIPEQKAFNMGDLYVQKADLCLTIEEVEQLHKEMVADYTHRVVEVKKEEIYSKPVLQCMDYIYWHLHKKLTVEELAAHAGLNPSYLSVIFKKHTGIAISDYIRQQKLETAKNMLRYSEMSCSEIANTLAYSSQSYFIAQIKKATGLTPRQYQLHHYQQTPVSDIQYPPVSTLPVHN